MIKIELNKKSMMKKALLSTICALTMCSYQALADDNIPDPFANMRSNAQVSQPTATGSVAPLQQATAVPVIIPEPPTFDAQSWVLLDYYSGRIITEHNKDEKIWPASLTKMMTAYVIGMELKAGRLKMEDDVTIPENAWAKNYSDSSKMFIEVGKTIKVGDLLRGIIIQSGNDACVAMAVHLAGTEEGFVSVMNSYAQRLGLKNTHFSNVHGLMDEMNYSTAYDMALLGRAVIRDLPGEYPLYSQKEFTFNGIKQYNRNRLLWDKTLAVDGIKTGHLSEVGYNLVTSAVKDNMRLVASVIGAKSDKMRAADNRALLLYGFNYFQIYTPFQSGKALLSRTVRLGDKNEVQLGLKQDLSIVIPRGSQNRMSVGYRLKFSQLVAPIKAGDILGTVDVKLDDKLLSTAPLIALEDVNEGGFFSRMLDRVMMFFTGSNKDQDNGSKE